MGYTIRQAFWNDTQDLLENLREEDEQEIVAGGGYPATSITDAYFSSRGERYAAVEDSTGRIICLFGMVNRGTFGVPWMLATPLVSKYSRGLVKEGRKYVSRWQGKVSELHNRVHRGNTTAILWLIHLGFNQFRTDPTNPAFTRFAWKEFNV